MIGFDHPSLWWIALPLLALAAWSVRPRRAGRESRTPAGGPGEAPSRTLGSISGGLRALVVLLLVAAAAGAHLLGTGRGRGIVLLLDASGSLAAPDSRRELGETRARLLLGLPGDVAVSEVAFGAGSATLVRDARAGELAADAGAGGAETLAEWLGRAPVDPDGTDPAGALVAAAALLEAGPEPAAPGSRRIVLLSDGQFPPRALERALAEARALSARGVRVDALAAARVVPYDLAVASLRVPAQALPGEAVRVEAVIASTRSARAEVACRRVSGAGGAAGAEVGRRTVELAAFEPALVAFLDRPAEPGAARYEVEIVPAGGGEGGGGAADDRLRRNDRLSAVTLVEGEPRVAVVSRGRSPFAEALGGWAEGRCAIERIEDPARLDPDGLAGYAAVVLDGLAREDLTGAQGEALVRYVRDAGGGLLALGGPRAFGAGGWTDGAALVSALPFRMTPRESRRSFFVFALDCSGSMSEPAGAGGGAGTKLDAAKLALLEALAALSEADRAAVVGFSDAAWTIVSPRAASDSEAFRAGLSATEPHFGTDIFRGLAGEAYPPFEGAAEKVRAVVLLSDGIPRVPGEDLGTMHEKILAAIRAWGERGVTLWTVGLGTETNLDRAFLREMAAAGGGEAFFGDVGDLAERVLAAVQRAKADLVREESFVARAAGAHPVLEGVGEGPEFPGRNRVSAAPGARVLLLSAASEEADPILALRGVGLGRTAALASAFGPPWGEALERSWRPRARLVRQTMGYLLRRGDDPRVTARVVEVEAGVPRIEVRLRAEDGRGESGAKLFAVVEPRGSPGSPDGSAAGAPGRVALREVALGRYAGELPPASGAELCVLDVYRSAPGAESAPVPVSRCLWTRPCPAEYLRLGTDFGALERIARAGGGRSFDAPEALAAEERALGVAAGERPLRLALLAAALAAFLAELALRAFGARALAILSRGVSSSVNALSGRRDSLR